MEGSGGLKLPSDPFSTSTNVRYSKRLSGTKHRRFVAARFSLTAGESENFFLPSEHSFR